MPNIQLGKINGKETSVFVNGPSELKYVYNHRLVKLGILSTLAGYEQAKKVKLLDSFYTDSLNIKDFINFLLNHEGFAPIHFDVDLSFGETKSNHKIQNESKLDETYILASGGIDSTASIFYLLDKGITPNLVYIHFGQFNNDSEFHRLEKISKKFNLRLFSFSVEISSMVKDGWGVWDYIVPARNFFFASFAAALMCKFGTPGRIVLAATEEEYGHPNPGPDKSKEFYSFLTEFYSKETNLDIIVYTPFTEKTKSDILSIWKNSWEKKYMISPYDTSTCYFGTFCGECNSCFKRSISLISSGYNLDPDLVTNPFFYDDQRIKAYLNKLKKVKTNLTTKRKLDTIISFYLCAKNKLIPEKFHKEINLIKQQFNSEVLNRARELNISFNE